MAEFESRATIPAAPQIVFDFLIRPSNIVRISPEEMGLKIIDGPEVVEVGSRVELEISGLGIPQRLVHEIVEFERPNRFVERQVEGPMRSYVHSHLIEAAGDDEVVVVDRIEFEPPGGMLGFLVTEQRIRESLEKGLAHRHRALRDHFDDSNSG